MILFCGTLVTCSGMTGMQTSDIRPGVVVFGRLMGFPWWPAVVSKSPENGDWMKAGKFWVLFFNETNGAWLKQSELRSFDSYNKDLCLEQNTTSLKFRRYKERVTRAIDLAEIYRATPKGKSRSNGLPPRPSDVDVVSISDDEESEASDGDKETDGRKRRRKGQATRKKKPRLNPPAPKKLNALDSEPTDEEDAATRKESSQGGRPRRKRVRSSKYEEFMAPRIDRLPKRKGGRTPADTTVHRNRDDHAEYTSGNPIQTNAPSLAQDCDTGRRSTGKRPKGPQVKRIGSEHLGSESKRHNGIGRHQEDVQSPEDTGSDDPRQGVVVVKMPSRRLANDPIRHSRPMLQKRSSAAKTRQLYLSELTSLASPKTQKKSKTDGHKVPSLRKSVRSRAGGSSGYDDTSQTGQGTDSEEWPERERKVRSGSLEAAAEDLVEYAVRGGRGEESDSTAGYGNILDMNSVALGGSGLVSSILNRISHLERNVTLLQKKSMSQEVATLGEDATAAGVKSAVEALASASAAFAKARDYDSGIISRSLDLLWADGHFPLSGPDGELLRTVARSLVLASCKRKREHISHEKIKRNQRKPLEKEHINMTPIMQKADIRKRARKTVEEERDSEDNLVPRNPPRNAARKFVEQQRSFGKSPSESEDKIPPTPEGRQKRDEVGPGKGQDKREVSNSNNTNKPGHQTIHCPDKKSREGMVREQGLAKPSKSPKQRITYTPEKKKDGTVEVVEEEILGEEGSGTAFEGEEHPSKERAAKV